MRTKFFDASGRQVDETVACDTNGVIRHGYSMSTALMFMDSADPYAFYDAHDARLSNAWRGQPKAEQPQPTPRLADGKLDVVALYDAHDKRLSQAWRHAS